MDEKYGEYSKNWWFKNDIYTQWNKNHKDWTKNKKDLPSPEKIIEVNDEEGNSWIWLEIHPEWREPEELWDISDSSQKKRLWYQIRSYLVKSGEFEGLEQELNRDFHRGELPEARSIYTIFSREYYWSPAFYFFNKPYYHGEGWIDLSRFKFGDVKGTIHRTCEEFNWEEEFDCSKNTSIQYYKPTSLINHALDLGFSDKEGELINELGQMICYDPSVNNPSISGLLVRKDELLKWLDKEGLILLWTVIGEKQVLGHHSKKGDYPSRLNISGLYKMIGGKIEGSLKFKDE